MARQPRAERSDQRGGIALPDMRPWSRRALAIPPESPQEWFRLAVWEMWMGTLVCGVLALGIALIVTSPDRIVAVADLSGCYAPPPVVLPCERIEYRGGALNAAFTVLCGVMLIGVALWFLWEVWSAVEPKPIRDEFLKLLHQRFGRSWRNPLTWPWTRLAYAYGFTLAGAMLAAAIALTIWTFAARTAPTPAIRIDTSQNFHVVP